VLVLDGNDFECLVGREYDQQQVADELPWETLET
jgi:hypothetical protein